MKMKRVLNKMYAAAFVILASSSCASALPPTWTDHMPYDSCVFTSGPARFTVLSPRVIRMEFTSLSADSLSDKQLAAASSTPKPKGGAAPPRPVPEAGPLMRQGWPWDNRPTISVQNRKISHACSSTLGAPNSTYVSITRMPGGTGTSSSATGGVHIETEALTLKWNGDTFLEPSSLSVTLKMYPFTTWQPAAGGVPGAASPNNLHGTIRTLDRVGEPVDLTCLTPRTAMEFYAHCEEGIISKDGYAVIDDSVRPRIQLQRSEAQDEGRHVLEDWPWPVSGPRENIKAMQANKAAPYQDLYFMGYGLEYMDAIQSYVRMSGPIPLLPRYALGTGFSRWFAYGQLEEQEATAGHGAQGGLLNKFEAWGIPLDMLSIDMDWHTTGPRGQRNHPLTGAQNEGWTGWSWERTLFPAPTAIMAAANRRGVAVNLNQHPADGVAFDEDAYPAMASAVGLDPMTLEKVEFDSANQSYVAALLQHVLKPLDDTGMAFWWQDYQHGPFSSVPMLNPTYLTNLYLWESPWRYGSRRVNSPSTLAVLPHAAVEVQKQVAQYPDRPFLFGRWSGLGGHRMPIGFAGDTAVKWRVLRYESYFDATASNVAFMWSNDIGGFEGSPEPELMVRWSQWGALSAMLRGHSSKMSPARTGWTMPHPYFGAIKEAWRMRAALLPFISAAQRDSHETGLQLMRPMYWHYPAAEAAYGTQAQHQYFFGPGQAMWVAPISAPLVEDGSSAVQDTPLQLRLMKDQQAGGSKKRKHSIAVSEHHGRVPWTVWVPPGTWIEWNSWQTVTGDATPQAGDGTGSIPAQYNTGAGSYMSRNYTLAEIPMFSPPGAIVIRRVLPGTGSAATGTVPAAHAASQPIPHPTSMLGLASKAFTDLAVWVFPLPPEAHATSTPQADEQKVGPPGPAPAGGWAGATGAFTKTGGSATSSARLYEDDGRTGAHAEGRYADSDVTCTWSRRPIDASAAQGADKAGSGLLGSIGRMLGSGKGSSHVQDTLTCQMSAPRGLGYGGQPAARVLSWRMIGVWPPAAITVDGQPLSMHSVQEGGARDQAAVPDNNGEHGAWLHGMNAWAYHGPSASLWVHLGKGVNATATAGTAAARVREDGSTSPASPVADSAAVHTISITFPPGHTLTDPLLSTLGLHRMVARSLTCKEEVDRSYGVVYPSDIPSILNVSAQAILLSECSGTGPVQPARELMQGMLQAVREGLEGVQKWNIPDTHPTLVSMQHHCLGSLYDALSVPSALPVSDPRAVHAARPLTFSVDIRSSKGSAPGMVSQHEGEEAEDDTWEGKGWSFVLGGTALPPSSSSAPGSSAAAGTQQQAADEHANAEGQGQKGKAHHGKGHSNKH